MRKLLVGIVWCVAASAQLPQGSLWHDPGDIAALDLAGTMGAPVHPPKAPFMLLREDMSGTQPKFYVSDGNGITWNVKFGFEVRPESFCWRIVRACGYFSEPSFFVASGKFEHFHGSKRTTPNLHEDGSFTDARFQYRDPELKFLSHQNWRWDRPPFGGTKELSGLKILIMLFSNWDNKDARAGAGGPNTTIFQSKKSTGPRFIYAFTDWGAGFGEIVDTQTNWRCDQFTNQSRSFVRGVEKGLVEFSYEGAINDGFHTGIPITNVVWFMNYLGRISDTQFRAGLIASGANAADAACFTAALRTRIEELRTATVKVGSN